MTDEELKPCPFCGRSEINFGSSFRCKNCLATGPMCDWDKEELSSENHWNSRPTCETCEYMDLHFKTCGALSEYAESDLGFGRFNPPKDFFCSEYRRKE